MFTNVFCFLYIYLMHWSDSHRHLCCLDTQYVMNARKLFLFFFFFLLYFVHVLTNVSPHPSCIFLEQSLLLLQTFCVFVFRFLNHLAVIK